MSNRKIKRVISKHFIPAAVTMSLPLVAVYYVEAKPSNWWVRVGGPFTDEDSADAFAKQYSLDHLGTEVQVVLFQ